MKSNLYIFKIRKLYLTDGSYSSGEVLEEAGSGGANGIGIQVSETFEGSVTVNGTRGFQNRSATGSNINPQEIGKGSLLQYRENTT